MDTEQRIRDPTSRNYTASVAVNAELMATVEGIRRTCVDLATEQGKVPRKINPSSIMYHMMLEGAKRRENIVKTLMKLIED